MPPVPVAVAPPASSRPEFISRDAVKDALLALAQLREAQAKLDLMKIRWENMKQYLKVTYDIEADIDEGWDETPDGRFKIRRNEKLRQNASQNK